MSGPISLRQYIGDLFKGAREDHKVIQAYGAVLLSALAGYYRYHFGEAMSPAVNVATAITVWVALGWGLIAFFIFRPLKKLNEAIALKEAAELKLKPLLSITGLECKSPFFMDQVCQVLITNESLGLTAERLTVELEAIEDYNPSFPLARPPFKLLPEQGGAHVLNPGQSGRFDLFHLTHRRPSKAENALVVSAVVRAEKQNAAGEMPGFAQCDFRANKTYRLTFKLTAHQFPPTPSTVLFLTFVSVLEEKALLNVVWGKRT